jgi:TonB family protein
MIPKAHHFLSLVSIAFLVGCASTGPSTADGCRSDLHPYPGSLVAFVDSATLQYSIADRWVEGQGLTIASLSFDSDGVSDHAVVSSKGLPAETKTWMEETLRANSIPQGSGPHEVNLVLGDSAGARVWRVRQFQKCKPEFINRDEVGELIEAEGQALSLRERRKVTMQLFIDEDGTVGKVRLGESSGDARVDMAAGRVFRRARFSPARIEEIPVSVWISLDMTFKPRREST